MLWRTMTGVVAIAAALSGGVCYADDGNDKNKPDAEQSIVQQGFAISPIPKDKLNMAGKDPELVGLGSYLVNAVADCNGCHALPKYLKVGNTDGSNPNYNDPYFDNNPPSNQPTTDAPVHANVNVKHFMAGGRCFGPFMSRNATPDAKGLPAGLTEAEFIRMMRSGEDISCEKNPTDPICSLGPDTAVLQTMSWPTFHNMTDRDLKAIYAYLSAIPPAEPCNTPAYGCPSFSGPALLAKAYAYPPTNDCPLPPPPQ